MKLRENFKPFEGELHERRPANARGGDCGPPTYHQPPKDVYVSNVKTADTGAFRTAARFRRRPDRLRRRSYERNTPCRCAVGGILPRCAHARHAAVPHAVRTKPDGPRQGSVRLLAP